MEVKRWPGGVVFGAELVTRSEVAREAVKSQKAVSAYLTSKQILPFGFAEHRRAAVFLQFLD